MRRVLPLLVLRLLGVLLVAALSLAPEAGAEDLPPEKRVHVTVTTSADQGCYVGERVAVWLTIMFDKTFLDEQGVALFSRDMELPLHVQAPWLGALPGALRLLSDDVPFGLRFALDDRIVSAPMILEEDQWPEGWKGVSLHARFAPTAPGVLHIPKALVRFAYATKFEDDFVGGRVAIDRKNVTVSSAAQALEVRALPEAGKPAGFSGAVGRFDLATSADESGFQDDGLVRLTLRFTGSGNFETWAAPALSLDGLHVYGATEKKEMARRTITYEIAPTSADAAAIPSISFSYFDPTQGRYETLQTEAIPLQARQSADAVDAKPPAVGEDEQAPGLWPRLRNCLGMLLLAALVGLWARRRWTRAHAALPASLPASGLTSGPKVDDGARRARIAAATTAARAALGTPGALDALVGFLAAHLEVSPGAVVSPDLAARLRAVGVPAEVAGRAARVIEQGTAARYGAPAADAAPDAALLDALQEALRSA